MSDMPADPFPEIVRCADACTAIGMAVLDRFVGDEAVTVVTVTPDGKGGWWIGDDA